MDQTKAPAPGERERALDRPNDAPSYPTATAAATIARIQLGRGRELRVEFASDHVLLLHREHRHGSLDLPQISVVSVPVEQLEQLIGALEAARGARGAR